MPVKATIRGETILKYLHGPFGTLPTKTLSRKIYEENKALFASLDGTRSLVRYYRAQSGQAQRTRPNTIKTQSGEHARLNGIPNPFYLPESDEVEWPPYVLPLGKKYLLLSDIHLPYHNVKALTVAFEKGLKEKVDAVILNGDTLDFHQISRYEHDPSKRKLSGELEMGREFLRSLKKVFPGPIYFKIGNHEERYESYLRIKAPELLDIKEFRLDVLLRFGEIGVELITDKRVIKAGELNIMHGHEFGRSMFSPVNPARGYYMRAKTNTICGHNHQTSEHSEKDLNGSVTAVWSTGALCELTPAYMPINKWNHGFAIVNVFQDGSFEVDNFKIINGKLR